MRKLFLAAFLFLNLLSARAQNINSAPVFILQSGQDAIQVYNPADSTLQPACDSAGSARASLPVISPNGAWLAFSAYQGKAAPPDFAPRPDAYTLWMWICDTGKPARATAVSTPTNGVLDVAPAWSLDGRTLAWIRITSGAGRNSLRFALAIYSLDTRSETTVYTFTSLPDSAASIDGVRLFWGAAGIAVAFTADAFAPNFPFYLISPEGRLLTEILADVPPDARSFGWVDVRGEPYFLLGEAASLTTPDETGFGLGINNRLWLLNPRSGQPERGTGRVMLYSALAGDRSIRLERIFQPGESHLSVTYGDFLKRYYEQSDVTIAPNGQQIGFVAFEDYPRGGTAYLANAADLEPAMMKLSFTVTKIKEASADFGSLGANAIIWGPLVMEVVEWSPIP